MADNRSYLSKQLQQLSLYGGMEQWRIESDRQQHL
jgi:hypothetical protein